MKKFSVLTLCCLVAFANAYELKKITAPPEIRVRRIMAREGISEEYARSRVKAQHADDFFTSRCQYTLINDCAAPEEFAARAKALFDEILANHES